MVRAVVPQRRGRMRSTCRKNEVEVEIDSDVEIEVENLCLSM